MLQRAASWKWDNETDYPIYGLIPSRNGFFKPGNDANQAWPAVRQLLFTFISRSADSVTHCHGEAGKRTSKSCRGNRRELKVNCESAILGGLTIGLRRIFGPLAALAGLALSALALASSRG
jgi:hypothetical protein